MPIPDPDLAALEQRLARLKAERARRDANQVELVVANDIEPEAIDWLWEGWLARGKLHLLAGSIGAGKTTLALSLAAILTKGGRFADGTSAQPADVLMWSGEDDPADSLVPRFLACGGDAARLVFAKGLRRSGGTPVPFDPARDLAALARAMQNLPDLALLIVDPIVSVVRGDTDKNATARRFLSPLVGLAAARNIAVLGISHFGKTRRRHDPCSRILGAHAFTAMARLVMATAKSNDGYSLLVRTKSNIGPDGDGFAYTLAREEIAPGVTGQKIVWGDPVEGSAQDLLREAEPETASPQLESARDWLAAQLGCEGVGVGELMLAARAAGHAWITVKRAKQRLGVKSVKRGVEAGWLWVLPQEAEKK